MSPGQTVSRIVAILWWGTVMVVPGPLSSEGAAARPSSRDGGRNMREMARFYGFPKLTVNDKQFVCRSDYSRLVFNAGSRTMEYNGIRLYLNGAAQGGGDGWRIKAIDADTVVDPLLRAQRVLARRPTRVVVLDPGHGGHDPGAVGARNVQEKRVVLDVARRVRAKLAADGFTVRLTRDADAFIGLSDRVERANAWDADVFVSIHLNGSHNTSIAGVETFVLPAAGYPATAQDRPRPSDATALPGNRFDAANTLLGYLMQRELLTAAAPAPDRGVKRARFAVLKNIACPAVLVECGFVTNPREEQRMLQADHRDRLAEAIARGIRAFTARSL